MLNISLRFMTLYFKVKYLRIDHNETESFYIWCSVCDVMGLPDYEESKFPWNVGKLIRGCTAQTPEDSQFHLVYSFGCTLTIRQACVDLNLRHAVKLVVYFYLVFTLNAYPLIITTHITVGPCIIRTCTFGIQNEMYKPKCYYSTLIKIKQFQCCS